jgi:hypothetical protein
MGKYKQWLHHQEIGRRLRDQINTLEQERGRVQKMAPTHTTALPNLDNPIISALLDFTRQGNKLSNIDVIKAALPPLETDPDQRQPATSAATSAPVAPAPAPVSAKPAGNDTVVASLLARAEQMPSDPLEQMQELSRSKDAPAASQNGGGAADSVGGWWQRQRTDDQD